jgi:glycosyltransferase involved in cell wall biosynthesis
MCVKNGSDTIETALKSIKENNPSEIIIIDGNSKDNSIEIGKMYTDKIISDKGKGLAYARQLGAEIAKGEYVAYIDSDIELPDNKILMNMLNELLENNYTGIHAQMIDPRENKSYWAEGEDFHFRNSFNKSGDRKILGTIVCIIKKNTIIKYKFDPFFTGATEDWDFYYRAGKDGCKFGVSKFQAFHFHRTSKNAFIKQRIWYGKGNAKAIIKDNYLLFLIMPFGIFIYGVLLSLKKRKFKFIYFYLMWMIILFYGTFKGLIENILN